MKFFQDIYNYVKPALTRVGSFFSGLFGGFRKALRNPAKTNFKPFDYRKDSLFNRIAGIRQPQPLSEVEQLKLRVAELEKKNAWLEKGKAKYKKAYDELGKTFCEMGMMLGWKPGLTPQQAATQIKAEYRLEKTFTTPKEELNTFTLDKLGKEGFGI